jgi:hypothetical protein
MIRTKSMYLALLAVLLSPMAANADLIEYDFFGTDQTGWTMNARVIFDSDDVSANVNLFPLLSSWFFEWTNGSTTFSNTPADSFLVAGGTFIVDGGLNALDVLLCTNQCAAGTKPSTRVDVNAWLATTGPNTCCINDDYGSWTGPNRVSVPEPGTLALFGMGLAAMGLTRRRKKI